LIEYTITQTTTKHLSLSYHPRYKLSPLYRNTLYTVPGRFCMTGTAFGSRYTIRSSVTMSSPSWHSISKV